MNPDNFKNLAIYVITYNRSKVLMRTLQELKNSAFSNCEITILDNCSTDDTEILFYQQFDNCSCFSYKKNLVNIGASGNVIQAFLISKKPYTWIVCDDDYLCFDFVDDIENELNMQTVDMIQVGGHASDLRYGAGIKSSPKELILQGVNYFRDSSFLPSTIYRTIFAQKNLNACFFYSKFMYPHMAFVMAAYNKDLNVYVSKKSLVIPSVGTQGYSASEHLKCWFNLSVNSSSAVMRNQMLTSQWIGSPDRTGLIRLLFTAVKLKEYLIALKIVFIFNIKLITALMPIFFKKLNYLKSK